MLGSSELGITLEADFSVGATMGLFVEKFSNFSVLHRQFDAHKSTNILLSKSLNDVALRPISWQSTNHDSTIIKHLTLNILLSFDL